MGRRTSIESVDPNGYWPGSDLNKRLLLVDGHAYAYRSYHAIKALVSPSGEACNALFGFLKALAMLRNRLQPTHLAVVWDGGLAKERLQLHPGYKALRPQMPADLGQQISEIQAAMEILNVESLEADGVEADDWIAAIAKTARDEGAAVIIASADKDFMQLVDDRLFLFRPNSWEEGLMDQAGVVSKTGVRPDQVCDWLSLIGDSVDGIEGVPSIGPKTARDLLIKYGSLEQMLTQVEKIESNRLRNVIVENRELIKRNQVLIKLQTERHSDIGIESLAVEPPNGAAWVKFCEKWGFNSLVSDFCATESKVLELNLN